MGTRRALRRLKGKLVGGDTPALPIVRPAETPRHFDRHLFICGLHRSGTTLLESCLRAYCDLSVLRAPVPESEGQHLQDVFPNAATYGGAGRFAFAPEMHPAPPEGAELGAARSRLMACWTPFVDGTSGMLMEKSPPNLTKIAWLRAVFPGAVFVIITRAPRAVVGATQKWVTNSPKEMIFHWHVAHDAAKRAMGADCRHIRYEDLCADPEAEIDRLIAALDLPRRATTSELPERFKTLTSSNTTYISALPPMVLGRGACDHFGYAETRCNPPGPDGSTLKEAP